MKRLLIVLVVILAGMTMPNQVQAQDAIQKYFEKYMDDENFTVVYISSKMFELFAKIDVDDVDKEVKEVINDLKGLRILVRDTGGLKYYKEAIKLINFNEYEELMTVRDEGTNVKFVVKEEGDVIKELLLIVGGDEEDFVLMSFVGKIDLEKISKLANEVEGVDGLEHLDKLGDKEEKNNNE